MLQFGTLLVSLPLDGSMVSHWPLVTRSGNPNSHSGGTLGFNLFFQVTDERRRGNPTASSPSLEMSRQNAVNQNEVNSEQLQMSSEAVRMGGQKAQHDLRDEPGTGGLA